MHFNAPSPPPPLLMLLLLILISCCRAVSVNEPSVARFNERFRRLEKSLVDEKKINLVFNQKKYVVVDQTIDIRNLTAAKKSAASSFSFTLRLYYLRGIEALPLLATTPGQLAVDLVIIRSYLHFRDKSRALIGPSCDDYLRAFFGLDQREFLNARRLELFNRSTGVFGFSAKSLTLDGSVAFGGNMCPFVFKDAQIGLVGLSDLINTTLSRNVFEFSPIDRPFFGPSGLPPDINSRIEDLVYSFCYRIVVHENMVEPSVFKLIKRFTFSGSLVGIDDHLFRSFRQLNRVTLRLNNFREFVHKTDNRWLGSLNYGDEFSPDKIAGNNLTSSELAYVAARHLRLSLFDQSNKYDYPDEDLCHFRHFPHRQMVFVGFSMHVYRSKSTCTLHFLTQYQTPQIVDELFLIDPSSIQKATGECGGFERRLELCENMTSIGVGKERYEFNTYDLINTLKWVEFAGPILTFPVVAFVGFSLNLAVVLVITNKYNQVEYFKQDRIFKFMLFNSIFNMIECFVSIFTLVSECLGKNSIYCSQIMNFTETLYFKVYFISYFGECTKTCSILTSLAFSFERYIVTSDSKRWLCVKFKQLKLKYLFSSIVAFSVLTCLNKTYEYNTNELSGMSLEQPDFNIGFDFTNLQTTLYLFHYIFNDLVSVLLNVVIDLLLLVEIKKDLRKKRAFILEQPKSSAAGQDNAYSLKVAKKLNDISKSFRDSNKMIVYTLMLNILCRFPELIAYILFLTPIYSDLNIFCSTELCPIQVNLVQYFYMLSYFFNIIFYYKYNKSFRHGFKRFFRRQTQ